MKQLLLTLFIVICFLGVKAQPGTLDESFGTNGVALKNYFFNNCTSSLLLKNGNYILAGNGISLVEFDHDGNLDTTFGNKGVVINHDVQNIDFISGIFEKPDGKLLAVGHNLASLFYYDIVIYQFTSDGKPDKSFGQSGRILSDLGGAEYILDAAIQNDGKMILTGIFGSDISNLNKLLITRFNPDGSLDSSFGNEGKNIDVENIGGFSVIVQQDGKIVVGGSGLNAPQFNHFELLRFNADGSLDKSFGYNGLVETVFEKTEGESVSAVALQSDGKIVATGVGGTTASLDGQHFAAARYTRDGTLDNEFGTAGKVIVSFENSRSLASSVVIQKNGKIVIGGNSQTIVTGSSQDFAVCRLNAMGIIDSSFGTNGKVITDIKGQDDVSDMILLPDGKIIATGTSLTSGSPYNNFAYTAVRYIGDPVTHLTKAKIIRWIKNHILHWQLQGNDADVDYYVIETNKVQSIKLNTDTDYDISKLLPLKDKQLSVRIKAVMKDGSVVYSDWISDATTPTIALYPNPVKDVLNITGLPNTKTIINITNRNGNLLITTAAYSSTQNINVSALKSGVYYVSVLVDGMPQTLQFIKQ